MKLRKEIKSQRKSEKESKIGLHEISKTPSMNHRYESGLKKTQIKDVSQLLSPKDVTSSQIRDF